MMMVQISLVHKKRVQRLCASPLLMSGDNLTHAMKADTVYMT